MKPVKDEGKILARFHDLMNRIYAAQPLPKGTARFSRRDQLAPPSVSEFKGIDPVLLYGGDDEWFFRPEDCSPLVEWPIDVAMVRDVPDDDDDDSVSFHVTRLRSVTPKDVRGMVHRISPFMLRKDVLAHDRGRLMTASGVVTYFGGQWIDADKRTIWDETREIPMASGPDKYATTMGGLAIALALRHRYEWAVNVGWEQSPSIRIVTDPTGLKELFRLRDVPSSGDRREALMAWVSSHWRKTRADQDVETYVRKHLRGATKFEWKGLACEVVPSRYDMETRDKLIAERNSMRETGTDRRERVSAP